MSEIDPEMLLLVLLINSVLPSQRQEIYRVDN
jgi:hypothetical protein